MLLKVYLATTPPYYLLLLAFSVFFFFLSFITSQSLCRNFHLGADSGAGVAKCFIIFPNCFGSLAKTVTWVSLISSVTIFSKCFELQLPGLTDTWKVEWLKCCDNKNKNKDISLTENNKNDVYSLS